MPLEHAHSVGTGIWGTSSELKLAMAMRQCLRQQPLKINMYVLSYIYVFETYEFSKKRGKIFHKNELLSKVLSKVLSKQVIKKFFLNINSIRVTY